MQNGNFSLALKVLIASGLFFAGCSIATAKSSKPEPLDREGKRTWIIELEEPSILHFARNNSSRSQADADEQSAPKSKGRRLDLLSPLAQAHSRYLDQRFEQFFLNTQRAAGETPRIRARYKNLLNGVALRLSESQAAAVRALPGVKSLVANEIHHIETDAGPDLIGASKLWAGESGLPPSRGEGIIIGILDTGVNWDHSSFSDPAPDGYNFQNPLGQQLGLCGDPEVLCSDKLIGVYDFTDEGSKGKGTHFHGSHTASIAAGNRVNINLEGRATHIEGVAPRANIVSYKVCREDDPATTEQDEEGCGTAEIISGLEQALTDGVDVVNFSIGGESFSPWVTYARLFLDLRDAGIFAATSAGNSGPTPASATNPGLAPWLMSVAAATHTRVSGALLQDLSGGDSEPPADTAGQGLSPVNGQVNGVGPVEIVWAGDYGFPLCGSGEPELLPNCNDHTGATNPFAPGTFDGRIVVCERGDYGRVEKGFNVMQAGAVGYILVNAAENGESTMADNHCIPGIHVGYSNGQKLQSWLESGNNHMATIGSFGLSYEDSVADVLGDFSSQGPNTAVPDVLVPNITAPGVSVLAAGETGDELLFADGTSMAAPHIAGGGALLLSVDPGLTPSQIQSMLQTTATTEVTNYLGAPANPFEMGSGRVQLAEAIKAGLYMDVTTAEFLAANPDAGGDPSSLNLPGMVNPECRESCSFTRRVSDRAGGASWTVTAENFPAAANVTVSPSSFTIAANATQTLQIGLELGAETIGEWVFGEISLSSDGLPDQHLTVAVFSTGGDLPAGWNITDDSNGGWAVFNLSGLSALPDATFSSGGLVKPTSTTQTLQEDLTDGDPFDISAGGVMIKWINVPEGSLWLSTRTPSSTSLDLDLYVGRDSNGDGVAEDFEQLCESVSETDIESCDIFAPEPGDYWVIVQNWLASSAVGGDDATLISALVGPGDGANLAASGPGITEKNELFPVRLSWDNLNALPGEGWLGAVAIGSNRENEGNIGVIPVYFNRGAISEPETFPLMDGTTHQLALDAEDTHDRIFIDVPSGASNLKVTVQGANNEQNDGLKLELVRLNFDDSLTDPPFAAPPGNAPVVVSAMGSGPNGPTVSVAVNNREPGRWYTVLSNSNNSPSAVDIRADVEFSGTPISIHPGLWVPKSRPELSQGYDYNFGGSSRALVWYTYDEIGQPVWFIAGSPTVAGNIWTADLLRVTNDGAEQQLAVVGQVSVTLLAENDAIYSFTLYGQSGSERMNPLSPLTCLSQNGTQASFTGLWFRGVAGLGGASILMNSETQAQIHYLFDADGLPRWLFAQDLQNPAPDYPELPMLQFTGYCAVCSATEVGSQPVGMVTRGFINETTGNWNLDYLFESPLSGSIQRMDDTTKLTDTINCK